MVKKNKQYIEIEKLDWGFIRGYLLLYWVVAIINLFVGMVYILTSFIPIINLILFGRYASREDESLKKLFYKKVKYEILGKRNKIKRRKE